jgi:hypothetical protein
VVLGIDKGWDAGLWVAQILALAKCGLRFFFTLQGKYRGILNTSLMAYWDGEGVQGLL